MKKTSKAKTNSSLNTPLNSNPGNSLDQALKESLFKGHYSSGVFDALRQSYRPFFSLMLIAILIGFLGRGAILFSANYIGAWVDQVCQGQNCSPAPNWFPELSPESHLWVLFSLLAFGFFGIWTFRIAFSAFSAKAVSSLYDEVTLRTSRFPMAFFDTTPSGKVLTRFSSDYGNVLRLFGGPLAEFISIVFDLIWVVILICFASPWFLPVVALAILGNFLIYRSHLEKLRELRRSLSAKRSPSISHFSETVLGLPVIRLFSRENNFFKRFKALEKTYYDQRLVLAKKIYVFVSQMSLMTAGFLMAVGILALVSANWAQDGLAGSSGGLPSPISIGAVGASFALIIYSGYLVQMFFDWLSQFEEALVGVERLNEYLRAPLEKGASLSRSARFATGQPKEEAPLIEVFSEPAQTLSLTTISLAYASNGPMVLKNISLCFEPGKKYGIIGRTGSGKSSLVQVLLGLYPPTEGEIHYGNRALFSHELPISAYRELFSYVSQDPFLFAGSLRENLCLHHTFSDDRLLEVLKEVGWSRDPGLAHLNLTLEEKGKNLSSGERQLVSFARAILNPKRFVILDEATSSIDPAHEELLYRSLKKNINRATLIVIAHKLTQLHDFDCIIWLDQGQIRKIAKPDEVLSEFLKTDLSLL